VNEISVHAEIDYKVKVGQEWLPFLQTVRTDHTKVLVVAPENVVQLAGLTELSSRLNFELFVTPDGEAQKNFTTVEQLWVKLGSLEFGRLDAIVGIGGGATTDLAGFVAATWLRGIAWYAIPTTLAGMVDAAVGGKTGINTEAGKNLVGSFYSPRAVCEDLIWLDSLSDRDFAAGLAEVIKTGYIRDTSILATLQEVRDIKEARRHSLELVTKSVAVKADVVSNDFKEGKLREILNFGHTLGMQLRRVLTSNFAMARRSRLDFTMQLSSVSQLWIFHHLKPPSSKLFLKSLVSPHRLTKNVFHGINSWR